MRFVGESARWGVLVSGTVRGRPLSERPVCDGVNCRSSPSFSSMWSVVSICSVVVTKFIRVGLSTRVGRSSGPGELAASPEFPVSFRLTGVVNKAPLRVDVSGGGVILGDKDGLTMGRWVGDGEVFVAREGDRDGSAA